MTTVPTIMRQVYAYRNYSITMYRNYSITMRNSCLTLLRLLGILILRAFFEAFPQMARVAKRAQSVDPRAMAPE